MANYTVRINLPNHRRGDTWMQGDGSGVGEGLKIGPIIINKATPPNNLVSCRMYFRDPTTDIFGYGLKSVVTEGFGLLSITDPVNWEIWAYPQLLDLGVGDWYWDFETTDSAGRVLTLYDGIMTVTREASYD